MAGRIGLRHLLREVAHALVEGDLPARPRLGGGPPIVVLHGFAASSRVLLPLERHLRRAHGRPVLRFALGGSAVLHLGDVRVTARRVHDELERLAQDGGLAWVDVIGHSLGGLVATYWLKCLDRGARIRRVVTLGTPHRGTPLALAAAPLVGLVSRAIWQMVPGAPLLRELTARPVPAGSALLAVASAADRVVPPPFALPAPAPGQEVAWIEGPGHLDLLHDSRALACVDSALQDRDRWPRYPQARPGIEAHQETRLARAA